MKTDESNPRDWFWLAKERLESADALVEARGICLSAVELLQESVERYLKGYLISMGWKLERIHDLNRLLDLSIEQCTGFSIFIPLAQSLTEQFWAQHYPGDDLSEVGFDYPELRQMAGELIGLIESETKSS
ncbi:MAG: HEPN domain-containing protein [Terrimicrobiaceae bacterium]